MMRYILAIFALSMGCSADAATADAGHAAQADASVDGGWSPTQADSGIDGQRGNVSDSGPEADGSVTGNDAAVGTSSGNHMPSGMKIVVDTGDMTAMPANGGQDGGASGITWSTGGPVPASCTCDSPTTPSIVGEWSGNIQIGPGGHGIKMLYPNSLEGGNSPGRFHLALPTTGTGFLYAAFTFEFSSTWSFSHAIGIKLLEPRTVNAGNNDYFGWNCSDTAGNPDGVSAWPFFALQGNQFGDIPGAPQGYAALPAVYTTPNADVGGAGRGTEHVVEFFIQPETPTGTGSNGQITFWIDNVLAFTTVGGTPGSGTGIPTAGITYDSGGFNFIQFDPTYGGDSATDHPPAGDQPMYWVINNLIVAVQ
jgi:hypothetical protein